MFPQLIEGVVEDENSTNTVYTQSRHFLGYVRYSHVLNREFTLNPTAIIRTTANSPLSYEIGALIRYQKMFWLSASYRKEETIAISLGGVATQ